MSGARQLVIGVLLGAVAAPSVQLLKLVDDLARQRPLKVDGVARVTQRTLHKVTERCNSFFDVFESGLDQKSVLSSIELRVPTQAAPSKGGLAVLTIDRKQCVGPEAVRSHVRREPDSVRPSNPSNPERSYTFEYQFDWGQLQFAFDSKADCLILVAIDQIEGAVSRPGERRPAPETTSPRRSP